MAKSFGLLTAASLLTATAASAQIAWRPCGTPGVAAEARCAEYPVWENREARSGRRISLRLLLLPALTQPAAPDPIVVLQGGPGASNVNSARGLGNSPMRARRDILLIDARGTGGSAPLDCDFQTNHATLGYLADFLPLAGVTQCRDTLSRRADLTQYVTPVVVDDFDEVRVALGIRQVNLVGNSGGTRQALVWMRRHPGSIRSAVLHGPVPVDARLPLTFARDAQDALDGVLGDCAAEAPCAARFPDLKADARAALANLDRAPAVARVAVGGAMQDVTITRSAYAQVIRYMLYSPVPARDLPRVINRAAAGDFMPLAEHAVTLRIGGGISNGFYLSNTCSEDLPFITREDAEKRAAGTYLGDYRYRQQRDACAVWPSARLPREYLEPVRSDVPVLIMVGQHDPVTPPRWGREIAAHLSRVRLVVVKGGGHGFGGLENAGCIDEVRQAFLDTREVSGPEPACLATIRRQPFRLPPPG